MGWRIYGSARGDKPGMNLRGPRKGRGARCRGPPDDARPDAQFEARASWPRISPPGNCVVCTFTYVVPARMAATRSA